MGIVFAISGLLTPLVVTWPLARQIPAAEGMPALLIVFWSTLTIWVCRTVERGLRDIEARKAILGGVLSVLTIAGLAAAFGPINAVRQTHSGSARFTLIACNGGHLPEDSGEVVSVQIPGLEEQNVPVSSDGTATYQMPLYESSARVTLIAPELDNRPHALTVLSKPLPRFLTVMRSIVSLGTVQATQDGLVNFSVRPSC